MDHASLTKGKGRFEWMMMTSLMLSHNVESASKQKGGSKLDGGYKKLHAIPKVDNDSLLRLLSSLALTTRLDKVV